MKESEKRFPFYHISLIKKFLKLYFSYFREEINSTQGFMKKIIHHYPIFPTGFLSDKCTASQIRILFHRRWNGSQSGTRYRIVFRRT